MSRSRLAPESLKRVSNLIPGILAGSVPDSDLEERNLGPPIALTTSYSFGVNVDEKSDTISSGYTRIYEDDSAIDHKSLSLELMTRYLYLGDHPPTLHPSEF